MSHVVLAEDLELLKYTRISPMANEERGTLTMGDATLIKVFGSMGVRRRKMM